MSKAFETSEFDVNRDLYLPIIMGLNADMDKNQKVMRENEYWIGVREGFAAGVREGQRQAKRNMQLQMGINPVGEIGEPDLFVDDLTDYFSGPVK